MNHKHIFKAFKALGEPTRLKIIKMLSIQGMCVCELSEVLQMLQPRVSQHLKILKEAELVEETKEGYWVYYSLNKEKLILLWDQFQQFLATDLQNLEGYTEEAKKIKTLSCNQRVNEIKQKLQEGSKP